jgi:hypothetical protein
LQPYPGDKSLDPIEHRFNVEYYSEAVSIIHDRLRGTSDWISMIRIRRNRFHLGAWYAKKCAHRSGIRLQDVSECYTMTDVLHYIHQWVTEELMQGCKSGPTTTTLTTCTIHTPPAIHTPETQPLGT